MFKRRLDAFKTSNTKLNKQGGWGLFGAPKDPKAMDMSLGRTHAQLVKADDFMPGGYHWGQSGNNPTNQKQ